VDKSGAGRGIVAIAALEEIREKSKRHHNASNPRGYRRFLGFAEIVAL
jgi:hypothetical protein